VSISGVVIRRVGGADFYRHRPEGGAPSQGDTVMSFTMVQQSGRRSQMEAVAERRRRSERARMELELLKAVVMLSAPQWEVPAANDEALPASGGFIGRAIRRITRVFGASSSAESSR
jgi:hypothetical protein